MSSSSNSFLAKGMFIFLVLQILILSAFLSSYECVHSGYSRVDESVPTLNLESASTTTNNDGATNTNAAIPSSSLSSNDSHEIQSQDKNKQESIPNQDVINIDTEKNIHHETKEQHLPPPKEDGTFMGLPIYHHNPNAQTTTTTTRKKDNIFHSTSHCIGDNFSPPNESWKFKTCQFQNLCFDTSTKDFVLFASPEQIELDTVLAHPNLTFVTSSTGLMNKDVNGVSIGGINPKWNKEIDRLKWFPSVLHSTDIDIRQDDSGSDGKSSMGVYMLPDDTVMVPWHSMAGHNIGHLIWDDWLPLYTILSTFDLIYASLQHEDKNSPLQHNSQRQKNTHLFVRYMFHERPLWAACDLWGKLNEKCNMFMKKCFPLLLGKDYKAETIWTNYQFNLTIHDHHNDGVPKSRYICSKTGAAGIGMLTDHGEKTHGWGYEDYKTSHNMNRAESLYSFRNYMMDNMGISTASLAEQFRANNDGSGADRKYKILFSINSSTRGNRMYGFDDHIRHLKQSPILQKYNMELEKIYLSGISLQEQIERISSASILVTVNGGGAVTSIFLPKGSSIFCYFHDEEGNDGEPARLDWDLINQLGYIRAHWLPRFKKTTTMAGSKTGPLPVDFDVFERLIDHELDIISHL